LSYIAIKLTCRETAPLTAHSAALKVRIKTIFELAPDADSAWYQCFDNFVFHQTFLQNKLRNGSWACYS